MNKDEILKNNNITRTRKTLKKVLKPFDKLKNRILKEFQKKKLIGDILISDTEYELLLDYFKKICLGLIKSNAEIGNDPVFAVALVQIGIRYYDGNFWGHIAEVLGVEKINAVVQGRIGGAFIKILSANNKLLLDKNERVNNILMHGFVSDYYANEMFEFFFKYYNMDLERDLSRNNSEMINNLIEVIQRNDNTGRTYLLVKQTANAIAVNVRGGKIRIRRLLSLIDKCFWDQVTPVNPKSRLSILFNKWQENSGEFKSQYNKYHNIFGNSKGKKAYSSPYIKCNFSETSFKLIIPSQLIKFEFNEDIVWHIYNTEKQWTIKASIYEAITGYKTEVEELNIDAGDVFNEFVIELYCKDKRLRLFKIKSDCIRFFDKEGNYLNSDSNLPKGEVYAYTRKDELAISDALIENEVVGNLIRSYFEFEYGDIVRLPDGKPISIGKKLEEGLLNRKILTSAHAIFNDSTMPIYRSAPSLLLKIAAKRANGTLIEINGIRHRLFDKETVVVELGDRSGETGYILNLGDYGCNEDGKYEVFIDVPNDRSNRFWQFALIKGINYEFEDAPYIFQSKGTIKFNKELRVEPNNKIINKNIDENSYNFIIEPDKDYLEFIYKLKDISIMLCFEIPSLKWKFGSGDWNIIKPDDIWYGDIPYIIYFKFPEDKLRLSLDEEIDNENALEKRSIIYIKSKAKGVFECDITRFKSWLGKEKVARSIFIEFSRNRVEFISVITRSVVQSHIIKWDSGNKALIGEFNIIGKANYYADIILLETKEVLADKLPIVQGRFVINRSIKSGLYRISIFEDEADDTGFGIANFVQIAEFKHDIINPYNLEGKNITIKYIKKIDSDAFKMQPCCQYIIYDLKLLDKNDRNNYKGKLAIKKSFGKSPINYDVNVCFENLNKLQCVSLTYFDGYDNLEFLFDAYRKIIVKKEQEGLTWAVKYRRYEPLYPEDYVFIIEFTNEKPLVSESAEEIKIYSSINETVRKVVDNSNINIEQGIKSK